MNYKEARKLQLEMNLIFANGMEVEDVGNFFFDLLNKVNNIVNSKITAKKKRKTRGVLPCRYCGSEHIGISSLWVEDTGYRGYARCIDCGGRHNTSTTINDNYWGDDPKDVWYNSAKEARDAVKVIWNKEQQELDV